MYILSFSVSSKETYLSIFNTQDKSVVTEKFVLPNDNGESLRALYNYLQLFISRQKDISKIIMEVASNGQRSPSAERVKSEGIIELVIFDLNLFDKLSKIKTQKTKKKYKELPDNSLWVSLNETKYASKIQQVIAYLLIEGLI
ncbi:hypothetical protein BK120_32470 [Paenibacillus sp. FSL A5-0031]|uniref:hypothetical protein n=1 Tax=Paenibacillus sp. FSL A5-0031 TaxID=1920420 RepID=UPI00096F0702|nr:hypothetical protein [Paenibacillus sp. FSL A5-0031]OME73994.1 hypothetical protein BK120_32470 [Paenibacillus sp. FSL A5-0031]